MFNNYRIFFTGKKAQEFIEYLESCEVTDIQITMHNDGCGHKVYRVEWGLVSNEE